MNVAAAQALAWQRFEVPWAAWYGDRRHTLLFPARWSVESLESSESPDLSHDELRDAIWNPIDSAPLAELARGKKSACIAIDDLARPTRTAKILPHVIDALHAGGLADASIRIVVATGTHGPPDADRLAEKIGPGLLPRISVETHDPHGGLAVTDLLYGGRPLRINRTFLAAELKIGIGCALPHPFAAYSGGAKLLVPGLSDLDATDRTHKFVRMGLRGGTNPDNNQFRLEIERIARQMGYEFAICAVPNRTCETAALFAGDLVSAHRRASVAAARIYATRIDKPCDCLILNAYPKDGDLVQALGSLATLKMAPRPIVREGGIVVLTAAATLGIGTHGLFAPGGANYREPAPRRDASKYELWLFAPGVTEMEARQMHWKEDPFFPNAEALALALQRRLGDAAHAAIIPCAPLQQIV
jgi:nickel-dependent lactate racemase